MDDQQQDLPPLTMKQQKFVAKYLEIGNAAAAYRFAYEAEGMKPRSIMVCATRLMAKANVKRHIDFHRGQLTVQTGISAGHLQTRLPDLLAQLEEAFQIAKEKKMALGMVTAVNSKAKLLGLDVAAKNRAKGAGSGNVEDMSQSELDAAIAKAKQQIDEMEKVQGARTHPKLLELTATEVD